MSKKILITAGPFVRTDPEKLKKATDILAATGAEIVPFVKPTYTMDEFKAAMPGTVAVIAGSEPWNEAMFKISPDLKIVSRFGVGYDAVDLAKAKEHGVMATNTRVHALSNGVAELSLALIMSVYRQVPLVCADLKAGKWAPRGGRQVRGKTVGIVGFGAIGKCFATLLQGFGVRILACDPYPDLESAKKLGVEIVSMDDLLAASDIVSLSAPNTPENRHLFNAAAFAKMKKDSVFVNTARGAMVDEAALLAALASGHLLGAGIDVWEQEPTPSDNPLLKLDNLVCLPHVAGENLESAAAIAECCAQQVADALAGKTPQFLLNP
jgi:D-3-phosphoglycerate dehydrogenase